MPMTQHGGKRGGAGRPKGSVGGNTIAAQEFRTYVIKRIIKERKLLVDALMKKAKKGDVRAIKELFDRGFGKAVESIKIEQKPKMMGEILRGIEERRNQERMKK